MCKIHVSKYTQPNYFRMVHPTDCGSWPRVGDCPPQQSRGSLISGLNTDDVLAGLQPTLE